MEMKIAMIHGQNHKGSSYHIGRLLAGKLAEENEISEFFLPRDLNHFCLGCYQCIEDETKCPFYEEKRVIMEAVEKAELLIFTTPTYCMRPTAAMKTFIELTFIHWIPHRPKTSMFHKKAVVISTAAGSGAVAAVKDMKSVLHYLGIPYIKTYGKALQAMNWEQVSDKKKAMLEKDMTRLSQKLHHKKQPKAGWKIKAFFLMMRMMQKADMGSGPADKQYWSDMGWLEKKRPWESPEIFTS